MQTVANLMKSDIIWVKANDKLDYAYRVMLDCGVRHLPVVNDAGELVGVLSEGDILLHSSKETDVIAVPYMPVAEAMSKDVVSCRPTTRLADAAATMIACKIDCLPVTLNGSIQGMATASDFLELICQLEEGEGDKAEPLDTIKRNHQSQTPFRDAYLR